MKPTHGEPDPPPAHRAQSAEADIGLPLPCSVVVPESAEGGRVLGFMDRVAVMQTTSNPGVAAVAQQVRARLERVRAARA